jgi:hypothetical protein
MTGELVTRLILGIELRKVEDERRVFAVAGELIVFSSPD